MEKTVVIDRRRAKDTALADTFLAKHGAAVAKRRADGQITSMELIMGEPSIIVVFLLLVMTAGLFSVTVIQQERILNSQNRAVLIHSRPSASMAAPVFVVPEKKAKAVVAHKTPPALRDVP